MIMVEGYGTIDPAAYVTPQPMTHLSYRSRLVELCQRQALRREGRSLNLQRLIAWVDAMCPYYGDEEVRAIPDPVFQGVDWLAIRPRIRTAPRPVRPGPVENGDNKECTMNHEPHCSRRQSLGGTMAAGAAAPCSAPPRRWRRRRPPPRPSPVKPSRKIKLGIIGCGGRGPWLGDLFQKHGGYEIHAVADYFADMADRAGDKLGVDKPRRFSGLAGYKRLLGKRRRGRGRGERAPLPRRARPRGDRGRLPRLCGQAGGHRRAPAPCGSRPPASWPPQKKLCYLVDYQMPTDPVNIEVVKRVHEGGLGRLMHIDSVGFSPPWAEPPVHSAEDRLRHGRWMSTIALSGDVITENTIHAINAVLWLVGRRPASAIGRTRVCRPASPRRLPRGLPGDLRVRRRPAVDAPLPVVEQPAGLGPAPQRLRRPGHGAWSATATSRISAAVPSILAAARSRASTTRARSATSPRFTANIIEGRCDNPTVRQAVDDALTAVLGREAAARRRELTMDELLRENRELEFDCRGLKA